MEEKTFTIELSDGSQIKNLKLNGNNDNIANSLIKAVLTGDLFKTGLNSDNFENFLCDFESFYENNFINDYLTEGATKKYQVYRNFVDWAKSVAKLYFQKEE